MGRSSGKSAGRRGSPLGETHHPAHARQRRWWRLVPAVLVGSALIAAATYAWLSWMEVQRVRSKLPTIPDRAGSTPGMLAQIREADHAVRGKPLSGERLAHLGQVYHANLFYDEAAVCYALAEQRDPNDGRWPYYRGVLCYETGSQDDALAHFQRADTRGIDHPCLWLRIGDLHLKRDALADAAEAYAKTLASESHSRQAQFGLARVAERQRDWPRVIDLLAAPAWKGEAFGPAYRLLSTAYREVGRKDEAERLNSLAESLDAGNSVPLDDPAIRELEDISYSTTFLLKQANLARWSGNANRRFEILVRAVEVSPGGLDAPLALAEHCLNAAWQAFAQGQPQRARLFFTTSLESARRVLAIDSQQTRAHIVCGVAAEYLGHVDDAIVWYRRALELAPSMEEPHRLLGALLAKQRKFEEAERFCRRAVELNPLGAQAHDALGSVYAQAGRWEEALPCFQRAREIAPLSPMPHCNTAQALAALRRQPEAVSLLQEIIQRWPDCVPARELLAKIQNEKQP